jgi:ankyrin repeat protein
MYMNKRVVLITAVLSFLVGNLIAADDFFDAVKTANLETIKRIAAKNPAIIKQRDEATATPLHWAATNAASTAIVELLIKLGAEVNAGTDKWSTPLHWAAHKNCAEIARTLLKNKASVNAKTSKSYTPLHWAAIGNSFETAKVLITSGATLDAKGDDGMTPMHWAIKKNNIALIELLAQHSTSLHPPKHALGRVLGNFAHLALSRRTYGREHRCSPIEVRAVHAVQYD